MKEERCNMGEFIRLKRKKKKLKIIEFSRKVGIKPENLVNIEKNKELPAFKVIFEIAVELKEVREILLKYIGTKYPEVTKIINTMNKYEAMNQPEYLTLADMLRCSFEKGEKGEETAKKLLKKIKPSLTKNKDMVKKTKTLLNLFDKFGKEFTKLSEEIKKIT
ncbi:MAG: helix-turn-helix domain-containing protein [Candidatus Omnitrophica bacterium]|nr:helix-turn-helix domain-containing protein [Candidatus Omnitrophota bacterium]MDD5430190.1 helix-turn-helix domain-containing protein [Candidatus Omnitrophota bacterium]